MTAYLIYNEKIFHIRNSPLKIGRSLENGICIQEPTISRRHAEITTDNDEFFLVDLSSTAGTYVNNQRIKKYKLRSGDSILIGNIPLVFVNNVPQLADKAKTPIGLKKGGRRDSEITIHETSRKWRLSDKNGEK